MNHASLEAIAGRLEAALGMCGIMRAGIIFVFAGLLAGTAKAQTARVAAFYPESRAAFSAALDLPPPAASVGDSLRQSQFALLEDGRSTASASALSTIRASGRLLYLVIAVDMSGSMRGRPAQHIRKALSSLSVRLGPTVAVTILSFAGDTKVEFAAQAKPSAFANAVQSITPRGKTTALFDALLHAMDVFGPRDSQKFRRVLLLSDGKDESSKASFDDVVSRATARHVPVDAIVVNSMADHAFEDVLAAISYSTGGRYAHPSADGIAESLNGYIDALEKTPVVRFTRAYVSPTETTAIAAIQFQRPGRPPVRFELGEEIAKSLPVGASVLVTEKAFTARIGIAVWLTAGVGAALILLFWRRRANQRTRESAIPRAMTPPSDERLKREPSTTRPPRGGIGRRQRTLVERPVFPFSPPGPGLPFAFLIGMDTTHNGRRFPVQKSKFTIGPDPRNDLRIENQPGAEAQHALIVYESGGLFLYNQSSRNGTFVNEHKVTEGAWNLRPGDEIRIGDARFRVAMASSMITGEQKAKGGSVGRSL